jgi:hypothetical protein
MTFAPSPSACAECLHDRQRNSVCDLPPQSTKPQRVTVRRAEQIKNPEPRSVRPKLWTGNHRNPFRVSSQRRKVVGEGGKWTGCLSKADVGEPTLEPQLPGVGDLVHDQAVADELGMGEEPGAGRALQHGTRSRGGRCWRRTGVRRADRMGWSDSRGRIGGNNRVIGIVCVARHTHLSEY